MNRVLILIDIQNDFITGELPVPDGRAIIDPVNQLIPQFGHVIATQDWHPVSHFSFFMMARKLLSLSPRMIISRLFGLLIAYKAVKGRISFQNCILGLLMLSFVREQTLI